MNVNEWLELARRHLNGGGDSLTSAEWWNANAEARDSIAAIAELVAASVNVRDNAITDSPEMWGRLAKALAPFGVEL